MDCQEEGHLFLIHRMEHCIVARLLPCAGIQSVLSKRLSHARSWEGSGQKEVFLAEKTANCPVGWGALTCSICWFTWLKYSPRG